MFMAVCLFFFFKQKTAYELRISDWSSDVCSSDLVFRPYGIKVWLSVNFASPKALGGLPTADPLDPHVAAWWRAKADEIYAAIPDFGGFLVKANSEGQPGPGDYHRSHAEGANMLAAALRPHHGVVIWRAFVYSADNAEIGRATVRNPVPNAQLVCR